VIYFEAEGPTEITPDRMPGSYNRLMVAQPSDTVTKAQAAEQIIRPFTSRAFRRPVREDEVQQLMAFWKQADAGHTFNESLQLTLQTVLASPQFLFRVEAEPQPGEPGQHPHARRLRAGLAALLFSLEQHARRRVVQARRRRKAAGQPHRRRFSAC
jgi:hypothetical protein